MRKVVFCRKTGLIGVKRTAYKNEEKEFGVNYVVDILDPVDLDTKLRTVKGFGEKENDWHVLSSSDPRVQFIGLFDVFEGGHADWYYDGHHDGDGIQVEEALVENRHEVFELVRKIFAHEKKALVREIARLENLISKG
jgi:hypothetical protein